MCICQRKIIWLSLMKYRTPITAPRCIFWKLIWLIGWSRKEGFNVYSFIKYQAIKNLSWINSTAEKMDLNHVVILIYQKTFIQTKIVWSVLKGKWGLVGYNVHTAVEVCGTTNSVFIIEFDPFFFVSSFHVG